MSKPSLSDFVASKKGPGCPVCALPEREEFDQARRDGVYMVTIYEWLTTVCGHEKLTRHSCDTHFQRKHHER